MWIDSKPIDCLETSRTVVNRSYGTLLKQAGLDGFDAVWKYRGGETIKSMTARSVCRFRVRHEDRDRVFYLKRHRPEFIGPRGLFRSTGNRRTRSQGWREFANICDFRKFGIATASPVAAGTRFVRFFWMESFFMSESFLPFISLEELLANRPEFFKGPEGDRRKPILLAEIAALARKMHENGFNHRDFNATHILLHYGKPEAVPQTALFDLQRVDNSGPLRFRWPVKTLAELNFTLPDGLFDEADRKRLLLSYWNKHRFGLKEKLLWRWIRAKTRRIETHTEHMLGRRKRRKEKGLLER